MSLAALFLLKISFVLVVFGLNRGVGCDKSVKILPLNFLGIKYETIVAFIIH